MAEEKSLTPEQEQLIVNAFQGRDSKNFPSITELVRLAFPQCQEVDGRSKEGRAVKEFLVARGLSAVTKTNYKPIEKIELTEAQKEYIRNYAGLPDRPEGLTPVEMAKTLFNNQALTNLHLETRTVAEYVRTLVPNQPNVANDVPTDDYRPPKTLAGVLIRVDKYVFDHGIDKENMTAQHKAGLEALLAYMNIFRFVNQMNLYETQTSRDLFESSFVRYCYDKPDLTEEEVDQYINVSHDNVALAINQSRAERLGQLLDSVTAASAEDRVRMSTALSETIGQVNTEGNQIAKRQKDLLGDLKTKRSDRIAQLRSANASILNLVQLWKEEKSRKKMIHIAEARKKVVAKAANELEGMSEIITRVMGIDKNFLLNG